MLDDIARFTQDTRLLRLTTVLGTDTLLAESVRGREAISDGYAFTITALSRDAGLSLRSLIGQPALLQLLTAETGILRPFHGYIAGAERHGANGGMARYALTLRPWSSFLAHTRDSRVFQDMTVLDILDVVFGNWSGRGKLAPAWRYDLLDQSIYRRRSLTTQYQESDLAFAERLMGEEGLFYFFEHAGDPDRPGFGQHQMVIADHNGAFKPNIQPRVRFTQPGAVMKEDSLDRWRCETRLGTNAIELRSWDYRTLDARVAESASLHDDGIELASREVAGQYAYPSRRDGQRFADRQMAGAEAGREVFVGAGTVRGFIPGTTFSLAGHAVHDLEDTRTGKFLITRVAHLMHNNLRADMKAQVAEHLGEMPLPARSEDLYAAGSGAGERPIYRNSIEAIRAGVPFRVRADGLRPRPIVMGQQTAVVVGPPGAVIHTDRDHRIKVQFHWQRGQMSHGRLDHPYPEGHTGAPGDDTAGTWVRVATPLAPVAGANWGSHALPRVGQEVLVDFIEGDIDRPVVIGALYNGRGERDAQHNKASYGAGVATGNAPAWFPGEAGGHAHAAVLSGLKSQAMQASQHGAGAFSQLVFDDTPGQARVSLQRHAQAHAGTDELNLGSLHHQSDNQRLGPVGYGAELKTEHGVALRAGQGLLLSADRRGGASGGQMDAREAHEQIAASRGLQMALAATADKHNARLEGAAAEPDKLPAIEQMGAAAKVVAADAFSEPQIQLSAPSGIVAVTPASATVGAGVTSSFTAGQDINFAAQANSHYAVKDGISLFTYGKATAQEKPNQEVGIKLHAASGKVSSQSQRGETRFTADKTVTVASVTKSVTAAAKQHLLLTAQGAYLKLEGGDIMLHAPGKVDFKATKKDLSGPANGAAGASALPKAKDIYNEAFVVLDEETKQPMAHVRYRIETSSGLQIDGITDELGRTQRVFTSRSEELALHLPTDE